MKISKGERRAAARQKERNGMRVTGKYFWIAIENSRVKRGEQPPPTTPADSGQRPVDRARSPGV